MQDSFSIRNNTERPQAVDPDPDRAVYRRYGLDSVDRAPAQWHLSD